MAAAEMARIGDIEAEIKEGTWNEALLESTRQNLTHGLKRTNADKRRDIERCLTNPLTGKWSDNRIAKWCGVSQPFVSSIKKDPSLITVISDDTDVHHPGARKFIDKHGNESEMDTSNIGKKSKEESPLDELEDLPEMEPVGSVPPDDEEDEDEFEEGEPKELREAVLLDHLGVPIPESSEEAFDREFAKEWREAGKMITALQEQLNKLAHHPSGKLLQLRLARTVRGTSVGEVFWKEEELDRLRHRLRVMKPFLSFCPRCLEGKKRKKKCPYCNDLGWLPKDCIRQLTDEHWDEVVARSTKGEEVRPK